MPFSNRLKTRINHAPVNTGSRLGRLALKLDFSVARIARSTGATRQTVYNWLGGGPVAPFYKERVDHVINRLSNAKTAEQAWKLIVSDFDLKA